MKYTIFNDLFKIISIFILSISNSYAHGGIGAPSIRECNAKIVKECNGKKGAIHCVCIPYYPSLPSWEEIKAQSAVNKQGIASFTLDFNRIPDSYQRINIDGFADYVTCNPIYGATRYVKSGYVYRNQSITGNYCKKWIIGISKNYMRLAVQSNYKNGDPKENVDIKLFCDEVEHSGEFDHTDPLVGGSYMLHSDHYVCRDGVVQNGSSGNCKVGTKYEILTETKRESYKCRCKKIDTWNEYCDTCYGDVYYYRDNSDYDTYKIDMKKYNINICHKPIIKKGIKMDIKYDPNLIYE